MINRLGIVGGLGCWVKYLGDFYDFYIYYIIYVCIWLCIWLWMLMDIL